VNPPRKPEPLSDSTWPQVWSECIKDAAVQGCTPEWLLWQRIAALEESLVATQEALREAIADARAIAEERDEWKSASLNYADLLAEVLAWRAMDDAGNGKADFVDLIPYARKARRLRAQNEGGEK
jgi:hypothetical protein